MQLWNRDLHAPFYYDLDSMLYLPLTRNIVEQGFWNCWHSDRMGEPGTQELYDFPIIDFGHFALMWLLGQTLPSVLEVYNNHIAPFFGFSRFEFDILVVYNAYSLLTYPLTVLTTMWVLRWLKLSLPVAALGGLLYAFLPYHQERYHYHYFLAAYWWVPVSLVPAIAICRGNFPYFRRNANGEYPELGLDWKKVRATAGGVIRVRSSEWKTLLEWVLGAVVWLLRNLITWRVLCPILIGAVTASTGAYYAFFACAAYGFAGVYGWIVHRTWRAAMSAILVIAPVFAVGVAYHLPSFFYHQKYGDNPLTMRQSWEADHYGLKLAHLLLPANDHNFGPFAKVRLQYISPFRPSEGESAGSFGIIGGLGLIALIGLVLLPFRRRWPEGPTAALGVFLVLLGSIGALGSVFNLLVTPQIRAYNRISVFIAFFAFFIVLWWIDRYFLTRTGRIMRSLRYPILVGLLILGYFDQTPWGWNPFNERGMVEIDAYATRYEQDKRFFQQIEKSMPPGSSVFCLPHSPFPESAPVHKMNAYEHARGYMMTDTLKWSFGAIKRREVDAWQRDVAYLMLRKPEDMLKRIVARGFDGVLIDGRGFALVGGVDGAAALMKRFNDLYRAMAWHKGGELPKIVHEDGKQFFLDLQPLRAAWQERNPPEYARIETEEREWVGPLWLEGFIVFDPTDDGEGFVWGTPQATMWLVNPTDRTRTFKMEFAMGVGSDGPFEMTISGPVNDTVKIERVKDDPQSAYVRRDFEFQLPPGRSAIRIRCSTPDSFVADNQSMCYFIRDFKLTEKK
jgi:hypothetical protein